MLSLYFISTGYSFKTKLTAKNVSQTIIEVEDLAFLLHSAAQQLHRHKEQHHHKAAAR